MSFFSVLRAVFDGGVKQGFRFSGGRVGERDVQLDYRAVACLCSRVKTGLKARWR